MYEVWTRPGFQPFDIWLLVFVGYLMASGLVAIGMYFRILADKKNEIDELDDLEEPDDLDEQCKLLFGEYLASVYAYLTNQRYATCLLSLDHDLMRVVEEAIDVPEQGVDDFRRFIAGYLGGLKYNKGEETLKWDSNSVLAKALRTVVLEHDHMERLGLLTS